MKYQFRTIQFAAIDPQEAGDHLETLIDKHKERLGYEEIVADARGARSPLHAYFEWDNSAAAEKHRMRQAQILTRSLFTKPTGKKKGTRAFVFVNHPDHDGKRVLLTMHSAMRRPEMRDQVLERAVREFENWYSRYSGYAQLRRSKTVMERLRKRLQAELLAATV